MSHEGETLVTYWKVLNDDGSTYYASRFRWSLPVKNADGTWTPGKWMTPKAKADMIGTDDLCTDRVLHVCEDRHLVEWLGPAIFEAEVDESKGVVVSDEKVGVRRARLVRRVEAWNERTARLFAVECAEDVLHLIPESQRQAFRDTLDVARRYGNGEATVEELAAARAAAWAAAQAARVAARVAAWEAAQAAAEGAAWDAAWDTARVARVAQAAAQDAESAAWDAAWDAARVGRAAQSVRLMALLNGEKLMTPEGQMSL